MNNTYIWEKPRVPFEEKFTVMSTNDLLEYRDYVKRNKKTRESGGGFLHIDGISSSPNEVAAAHNFFSNPPDDVVIQKVDLTESRRGFVSADRCILYPSPDPPVDNHSPHSNRTPYKAPKKKSKWKSTFSAIKKMIQKKK